MLINQVWQPLGGTRQAFIYPYLRKPDLLSSNSCLICTPEQIVLIDAGALVSQTHDLARVIRDCEREKHRPVVIYLTHCHIDHTLQLASHRQIWTTASVWIAAQEEGADYLLEGDRFKTIAELYGVPFPSLQPDIRLFTGQDRKKKMTRRIALAPGVLLTLRIESIDAGPGQTIVRQTASLGGGDHLEIYPARGHSPDSLCIRAGEVLFIGDLLAAANPMVAGISGWHRDDYLATLGQVRWLLEHLPIRFCYPGHGGVIPADKALEIFVRLEQKTAALGDVRPMNEDRLFQITDYALELIDEAEEVFSAIAGRLLYTAYQLERLEETEAANRCRLAMDMDCIDACLLDFRELCRCLDAGKIRRVEFAHAALAVVEKLRSLFDPRPLGAIVPRSLVNRGTAMLLDFIGVAGGRRNLEEFIPADVNALIHEVVEAWHGGAERDASVIDDADDDGKYLAALILRIGHRPEAGRSDLVFTPAEDLPFIRLAAGRFTDTFLDFLCWLGRRRPSGLVVATAAVGESCRIDIFPAGRDNPPLSAHEEARLRSFNRRFCLCGMQLRVQPGGFGLAPADEETPGERR